MANIKPIASFIIVFFVSCASIIAHGDIHNRIVKTTLEISKYPDSAYLYVKRGKLLLQHKEFSKSIADLKNSQRRGYSSHEQLFILAKSYQGLNNFDEAIKYLDLILKEKPKSVSTLRLKASILYKQRRFLESAEIYDEILVLVDNLLPENYLETAEALVGVNSSESLDRASQILWDGLDKMGDIFNLYEKLIAIALKQGNVVEAIRIQKIVVSKIPRKDTAYYKLSELHLLNNERSSALDALNKSLEHFYGLPTRLQKTSFGIKLHNKIKIKQSQITIN